MIRPPTPRDDIFVLYLLIAILAVALLCWACADWVAWK